MLWDHSVAQSRCSLSKAWLQICRIKSEVEQNQEKRVKKRYFFLRPHFPQLLYRLRGRRFAFLLITSARLHKRCQAIHRDTHTHVTSSCHPPVCSCCDRGCWLSVVYVCVCVCVGLLYLCVFTCWLSFGWRSGTRRDACQLWTQWLAVTSFVMILGSVCLRVCVLFECCVFFLHVHVLLCKFQM